jgi:hypothetical protein
MGYPHNYPISSRPQTPRQAAAGARRSTPRCGRERCDARSQQGYTGIDRFGHFAGLTASLFILP